MPGTRVRRPASVLPVQMGSSFDLCVNQIVTDTEILCCGNKMIAAAFLFPAVTE